MTVKIRFPRNQRTGAVKVRLDIDYKGVRKYETIGPDTPENRAEAERRKAEYEAGLRYFGEAALKGPQTPQACPKFCDYAREWLKGLRGLKQSTLQCYTGNTETHLIPTFGDYALNEITYRAVKLFLTGKQKAVYATKQRLRKGEAQVYRPYSKDALRLIHATLRMILDEAVSDELITTNPAVNRKLTKIFRKAPRLKEQIRPWTEEGLFKFEEAFGAKYPQYAELVLVMSRAGLRIGEAAALTWADLDFDADEHGEIDVNKNLPIGRELTTPKTLSGARRVPMSEPLQDALKALYARRRAEWFAKGADMPDVVFANEAGGYLLYSKFARRFKRASGGRTPHDLRHTFASLLLADGAPGPEVSKLLGHSSPLTTYRIYAHWIPDKSRESAVERIGRKQTGGIDTAGKAEK